MGRLIDVDKFKADYGMKDDCADCDKELRGKSKSCEFDRVYTKMDFCGWLDDAPTVDAVSVVRCKDYIQLQCNLRPDGTLPKGVDLFECRHWCGSCDSTDFCSRSERKDGDNETD